MRPPIRSLAHDRRCVVGSSAALLAWTASVTVLATACASSSSGVPATAPTRAQSVQGEMVRLSNEPYASSSVIPEPIDVVWPRLAVAYEVLEIPVEVSDADAYRIGNPEFRPRRIGGERLSRFVDCGQGVTARANADTYRVTVSIFTDLRPADEPGQTVVETLVRASGRARDTSSRPIPCPSKGQVERMIAEMIGRG